jgi:hypothetical protein
VPFHQLTLQFPVQDQTKQKGISELHKSFVEGTAPEPYSGVKKYKILQNDNTGLEIAFPQYKKPYHTKNWGLDPLSGWQWFIDQLRERAKQYSSIGLPISKTDDAVTPSYLNIQKVRGSRKVVIDYGFKVYPRDLNGNSDTSKIKLAVWTHVVYKYNKYEKRHVLSPADSYAIAGSQTASIKSFAMWFNEIKDLLAVKGFVAPWSQIANFDGAYSKWFTDFQMDYQKWLDKNLIIGLQDQTNTQKQTANSLRSGRLTQKFGWFQSFRDAPRYVRQNSSDIYVAYLTSDRVNSVIDTLIKKMNANIELFPSFYPLALKLLRSVFEDPNVNDEHVQNRLTYLRTVAEICDYYKDPTILRHLTDPEATIARMTQYQYTIWGGLAPMLANETFKNFPRSKQYRLLVEFLQWGPEAVRVSADLFKMLSTINTTVVDEDVKVRIEARQVRNLTTFHDQAVYLYNALRFKPKKFKEELTKFITDIGCKVPYTNYEIKIPEDTNIVRNWGTIQGHCIGSYADNMAAGSTILLGVWDTEKEAWFGHLQINPVGLNVNAQYYGRTQNSDGAHNFNVVPRQFYGKRNAALPQEQKNLVTAHLQQGATEYKEKLQILANAKLEKKEVINA